VTDTVSHIDKVYAVSFVTDLNTETPIQVSNFIDNNLNSVNVMFDPISGNVSKTFDNPLGIFFNTIGYIQYSHQSINDPTLIRVEENHHVYIFTENNVGNKKIWKYNHQV
tara:strand:- start:9374 stop:9703 length:330 start_codon:yes stop_codon:yes gene_type:complete